jgi:hypothetical protein
VLGISGLDIDSLLTIEARFLNNASSSAADNVLLEKFIHNNIFYSVVVAPAAALRRQSWALERNRERPQKVENGC